MHEPCHDLRPLGDEARSDEREAVLADLCRPVREPTAYLDLLVQVGGYGHLCARGPGVECDDEGAHDARIRAWLTWGPCWRPDFTDCDPC